MEAYHPLQLGHQETFSRVGVQGSNSRASVFEGISRAGWLLFLDLGKKVNGTSGKYVRNVFLLLVLTVLVAAAYGSIYYQTIQQTVQI